MKFTFTLILLIFTTFLFAQQLPYNSNSSEQQFIWNPAMTAPWTEANAAASYRQQWAGFNNAPTTSILSGQFPFIDKGMSAGGFVFRDQTGTQTQTSIGLTYAYHLQLGLKWGELSLGIMGLVHQFRYDGSKAVFNNEGDPLIINEGSKWSPNVGFGLFYKSVSGTNVDNNHFFIGIGSNQLIPQKLILANNANQNNFKRAIHAFGILGARFYQSYSYIEPSILVNYAANNLFNVQLNLKFEVEDAFWATISYATSGQLALQGGTLLQVSNGNLVLGARGSYNIGQLGKFLGFGYEGIVGYRFEL